MTATTDLPARSPAEESPSASEVQAPQRFTGFQRSHTTPRRVRIADIMAHGIITIGGFGTIAAVLMVAFYLVIVV